LRAVINKVIPNLFKRQKEDHSVRSTEGNDNKKDEDIDDINEKNHNIDKFQEKN
jgi:hypothetical protein